MNGDNCDLCTYLATAMAFIFFISCLLFALGRV